MYGVPLRAGTTERAGGALHNVVHLTVAAFETGSGQPFDYVLANKASTVWSTDWNGVYALGSSQSIEASQYAADVPYDGTEVYYSAVSDWWAEHSGVGVRLLGG
jgi:hypothetical protein